MGLIKNINDIEDIHTGTLNPFLSIKKKSGDEYIFDIDWNELFAWYKRKNVFILLVYEIIRMIGVSDEDDDMICAAEWMDQEGINTEKPLLFNIKVDNIIQQTCRIFNLKEEFFDRLIPRVCITDVLDKIVGGLNRIKNIQLQFVLKNYEIKEMNLNFEL